jgi:hypothetical protein
MNWKYFLIAIGCFVVAYLLRKLDKWTYGNPKPYQDMYSYGEIAKDWIWVIFLIICGIGFFVASLVS